MGAFKKPRIDTSAQDRLQQQQQLEQSELDSEVAERRAGRRRSLFGRRSLISNSAQGIPTRDTTG